MAGSSPMRALPQLAPAAQVSLRSPSASTRMGLKFGIHTMRGIPRIAVAAQTPILGTDATAADVADPGNVCEWNPDMLGLDHSHPAAQVYYDSTIDLYASWGVDFLKTDDMLWPYQAADIEAYSAAIQRSPRGFALSLSPGPRSVARAPRSPSSSRHDVAGERRPVG